MDTEAVSSKRVPPYVPYRTLRNFVDGFRQGIPQRIDTSPSIMGSMSGTIRRQLIQALRYLQLINENGIPQETLRRWVGTEGPDCQQILRESFRLLVNRMLRLRWLHGRLGQTGSEQG